jgi:hypothetical protein
MIAVHSSVPGVSPLSALGRGAEGEGGFANAMGSPLGFYLLPMGDLIDHVIDLIDQAVPDGTVV